MSALILFCRSPNRDLYINTICRALLDYRIETVTFCWIDTSQGDQDAIDAKIDKFFQGEDFKQNQHAYSGAYSLRRSLSFINILSGGIDEFIRKSNAQNPIYDVSGLAKEELIMVITSLLANDAKRVRFLKMRERIPKLFHQYSDVARDLIWVDVYDIANKYALFLENKEGRSIGIALFLALAISTATFVTTKLAIGWRFPGYAIDIFNFIGGTFPVTFAVLIIVAKILDRRRRAKLLRHQL